MNAVRASARDCGPTTFGVDVVRRDLADEDEFAYLADDGFLSYGFAGSSRAIEVSQFAAGSAATAAALLGNPRVPFHGDQDGGRLRQPQ